MSVSKSWLIALLPLMGVAVLTTGTRSLGQLPRSSAHTEPGTARDAADAQEESTPPQGLALAVRSSIDPTRLIEASELTPWLMHERDALLARALAALAERPNDPLTYELL